MAEARFVAAFHREVKILERGKLAGTDEEAFLAHETPLPVGTRLVLVEDDGRRVEAEVLGVVEQTAGVDAPGMRLGFGEAAEGEAAEVAAEDRPAEGPRSGGPPPKRRKRRR